jgi:hypothetical protein
MPHSSKVSAVGHSWHRLRPANAVYLKEVNMTESDTNTANQADLDAFRPLVASAWKEGELSELELAAVCLEIMRDPTSDLSCRDALNAWFDSSASKATQPA